MTALASTTPQLTCDDLLRPSPPCRPYLDRFRTLFPRRD